MASTSLLRNKDLMSFAYSNIASPSSRGHRAGSSARFACNRSREPLYELERLFGDLPPAGVDRERVPPARHLDDLGHAVVALLLLVCRVRDRPRNRMVRVGRDDQHRTTHRVLRVDSIL